MAYTGLAHVVGAKYSETENGIQYLNGFRYGSAVRIRIDPKYEDVSEYGDINSEDEEEMFAYASVTLETSEITQTAEKEVFGHEVSETGSASNETDLSEYIGLGARVREKRNGKTYYVAVWLYKVRLTEDEQDIETRGEALKYVTMQASGKAVPAYGGQWRKKEIFNTMQEADSWLKKWQESERKNKMAYVGLRKPIIAKLLESGKYDKPFACGKAIGLQVNPNYAEGSLNADDKQAEYDKEFTYAEVTLNTSTLPIEAHEKMFGHTVGTEKKNVKFNVDDQANYVGMAWVSVEKVDGVRSFIGNFLKKAKFTEPSEDYSTKGDSIEYKTPSISGRALGLDDGSWKETEACSSEEDALKWINTMFGVTE